VLVVCLGFILTSGSALFAEPQMDWVCCDTTEDCATSGGKCCDFSELGDIGCDRLFIGYCLEACIPIMGNN
jgi:hypothetical protein